MNANSLLDQAFTHYRDRRLDASFQLAVQAFQVGEHHTAPQLALLCLAEANRLDVVDALLGIAREHGLQPLELCRRACADMLKIGKREALANLAAGMAHGHPLRILALYSGACARMVAGDVEGSLYEFESFRLQVKDYMALVPFLASNMFNVSFRQATLVLAAEGVEKRLAAAGGKLPASVNFRFDRRIEADVPAIYAVVADGRYIERFARNLALAFDRPGQALHIHVINSSGEADAILGALPAEAKHLALGISRSEDPHYATSTSYACTRFFVLPELLRAYGKPVIALDIDILPREPLARLEEAFREDSFDFAYYVTGRNEPASVYQASIMAWAPNERALAFLDALGRFCLPKLDMPARASWLLDQAALISVMNWQAQRQIPFRYRPLNEVLGCPMLDAVSLVASEEEKGAIKALSSGLDEITDAEGVVHYNWSPD
jgi:hypothetical protein